MSRVGAIDCGTNSIRLLIADIDDDGVLTDVVRLMKVVRLGQGVDATGMLAEEALARTFAAAEEYACLLQEHGGPMLFGAFSIADAFFAPVCMRLRTYALPVPAQVTAYVQRVCELPGVKAWIDDALREHDFLDFEEPYRLRR